MVINQLPLDKQFNTGVLAFHRQLVQVAVGMAFLNGALDPTLASVRLRDGKGYVHMEYLPIHLCFAALAVDLAGEGDVDAVGRPFLELAGLCGAGAHVHFCDAPIFGACWHNALPIGRAMASDDSAGWAQELGH